MTHMTKVIYSEALRHRFQYYDDGTIVGFCNEVQDRRMADMFVKLHVDGDIDPYGYIRSNQDDHNETIVQADDWITIYER